MALLAYGSDPGSLWLRFMSADGKALEASHNALTLLTCVRNNILPLTREQSSASEIHTMLLCFSFFGIEYSAGLLQSLIAMNAMMRSI